MFAVIVLAAACSPAHEQGTGATSTPGNASATTALVTKAKAVSVKVNADTTYQTMQGFGATFDSLVFGGDLGDSLTTSQRERAVRAIFDDVRINTGHVPAVFESPAKGTLSTFFTDQANDNNDPNVLDWNGFFTGNGDQFKQKVVDIAGGPHDLYPEIRINLRYTSKWLEPLRNSDYQRFLDETAEQALAAVTWWTKTYGSQPVYATLFNEPLGGNSELGDSGSQQMVVDIVARAGSRLRKEGYRTSFVAPSGVTEEETLRVARAILDDPAARPYLGVIAYHPYPYGSTYSYVPNILSSSGKGVPDEGRVTIRRQLAQLGAQYGIPVWMTEVSHAYCYWKIPSGDCDDRANDKQIADKVRVDDFSVVRGRAIQIHDELTFADASAFFGMNSMWGTKAQGAHFNSNGDEAIYMSHDDIVLVNSSSDDVIITGMGRAIGHYARWINKGAVRVGATSDDPLVMVTAFVDATSGKLTLVIINNADGPRNISVEVSGRRPDGDVVGEQSTATAVWRPLDDFSPSETSTLELVVPAESVTSIAAPSSVP